MKTKISAAALLIVGLFFAQATMAQDGRFDRNHPRRAEVNGRLDNQHARIDRKVADGQMSRREANRLHREDHQIRHEERDMAYQDHGHITRQEQRTLNRQENHISRQIHSH